MNRRSLVTGLISLIAAPAIVRAEGLMQVTGDRYFFWQHSLPLLPSFDLHPDKWDRSAYVGPNGRLYEGTWTLFGKDRNIYSDKVVSFSKQEYPSDVTARL